MIYKVTKQFVSGATREQPCGQFKTQEEAKQYANEHARNDANMKIQAVYRVYEFDDVLESIDNRNMKSAEESQDAMSGSQGMQTGARFSPTPLEMAPRPKGTAPRTWSNPDDEKDKNK